MIINVFRRVLSVFVIKSRLVIRVSLVGLDGSLGHAGIVGLFLRGGVGFDGVDGGKLVDRLDLVLPGAEGGFEGFGWGFFGEILGFLGVLVSVLLLAMMMLGMISIGRQILLVRILARTIRTRLGVFNFAHAVNFNAMVIVIIGVVIFRIDDRVV